MNKNTNTTDLILYILIVVFIWSLTYYSIQGYSSCLEQGVAVETCKKIFMRD